MRGCPDGGSKSLGEVERGRLVLKLIYSGLASIKGGKRKEDGLLDALFNRPLRGECSLVLRLIKSAIKRGKEADTKFISAKRLPTPITHSPRTTNGVKIKEQQDKTSSLWAHGTTAATQQPTKQTTKQHNTAAHKSETKHLYFHLVRRDNER